MKTWILIVYFKPAAMLLTSTRFPFPHHTLLNWPVKKQLRLGLGHHLYMHPLHFAYQDLKRSNNVSF